MYNHSASHLQINNNLEVQMFDNSPPATVILV